MTSKKSDYHKNYYQMNKEKILNQVKSRINAMKNDPELSKLYKERQVSKDKKYYEAHKEEINARRKARYAAKKQAKNNSETITEQPDVTSEEVN